MKKLIAIILCLVTVLGLAACGAASAETPTTTAAAPVETTAAAETTGAAEETTAAAQDPKELAIGCIDKSVSELIALVGEPQSSDYAPSCLNPGQGEDGMLYYDGFVVYTYKEGDTETVQDVE